MSRFVIEKLRIKHSSEIGPTLQGLSRRAEELQPVPDQTEATPPKPVIWKAWFDALKVRGDELNLSLFYFKDDRYQPADEVLIQAPVYVVEPDRKRSGNVLIIGSDLDAVTKLRIVLRGSLGAQSVQVRDLSEITKSGIECVVIQPERGDEYKWWHSKPVPLATLSEVHPSLKATRFDALAKLSVPYELTLPDRHAIRVEIDTANHQLTVTITPEHSMAVANGNRERALLETIAVEFDKFFKLA